MIGWSFPLNQGGEEDGLNNSGIETFKGVPYDALAREIIQNSLDAKIPDSEKPVHVHFDLHNIDQGLLPGKEELEEIFTACREFKPDLEVVQDFFLIHRRLILRVIVLLMHIVLLLHKFLLFDRSFVD